MPRAGSSCPACTPVEDLPKEYNSRRGPIRGYLATRLRTDGVDVTLDAWNPRAFGSVTFKCVIERVVNEDDNAACEERYDNRCKHRVLKRHLRIASPSLHIGPCWIATGGLGA